jgi:hypothetical protein
MKSFSTVRKAALLLLCVGVFSLTVRADIKIKAKSSAGGTTTETATYIKGKRQRVENNPMTVTITQCDLRRTVELGVPTRTYLVTPFDQKSAETEAAQNAAQPAAAAPTRRGGIVTTTITTTDTGERKQFFGYTARRIKTAMVTESSPEACAQTRSRMETDGWYIDFNIEFDCGNQNSGGYAPPAQSSGCRDEYRTKQVGTARTGYPVLLTTTIFDESGKQQFIFTQEVVEISPATLDAALFEIPADYREVKDRQQMFSAGALASAAQVPNETAATSNPSGLSTSVQGQAAAGAAATIGPKKQGVMRIGVPLPKVTAAGEGLNPAMLAEAGRNTVVSILGGPTFEVIALEARLAQHIEAEAKQKECDYILFADLAHKKGGGGGFGGMLKKAAPVADVVPYAGGRAGAIAGTAARVAIYTAADLASAIKAKDELSLDCRLQSLSGTVVLANSQKAKAKSDNEDLLSNVVEQAASAIVAAVTKK